MSVKIKRKTGFSGSASPLTIHINEEKIGKIGHNQEIILEDIEANDVLQVTQFLSKSDKINLNGNETIKISTPKSVSLTTILAIIAVPIISMTIPNDTLSFTFLIILLSVVIILTLVKPSFYLEILEEEKDN